LVLKHNRKILLLFLALLSASVLVEITLSAFRLSGVAVLDKYHYQLSRLPFKTFFFSTEGSGCRKTNAYGFFDEEYNAIDTSTSRSLLYGNSFTEALQVNTNEVYDNILEKKLSKVSGQKIEIWNSAYSGMHLADYLSYYANLSSNLSFKNVIIQLNPDDINKPKNADQVYFSIRSDSLLPIKTKDGNPSPLQSTNIKLGSYSALWHNLSIRTLIFKKMLSGYSKKQSLAGTEGNDFGKGQQSLINPDTSELLHMLKAFSNLAAKRNSKVFLFCYPIPDNLESNKALEIICEKTGITFLDISSELKSIEKSTKYPLQGFLNTKIGHGHLNPHGHQVLAEILYEELKNKIIN
jgi:hypothetical protein